MACLRLVPSAEAAGHSKSATFQVRVTVLSVCEVSTASGPEAGRSVSVHCLQDTPYAVSWTSSGSEVPAAEPVPPPASSAGPGGPGNAVKYDLVTITY